jgi:hypothetical protein
MSRYWMNLLRWTYEIPDILTEESATALLLHRFREGLDSKDQDRYSADNAKSLLEAFIDLGDRGKLDDVFLPNKAAKVLRTAMAWDEFVPRIVGAANLKSPESTAETGPVLKAFKEVIEGVIDDVQEFARAYPKSLTPTPPP